LTAPDGEWLLVGRFGDAGKRLGVAQDMSTVRKTLLDAAMAALATQPWGAIRMVDVAAAAGVSRQTLYNEFGSKEGIAKVLARRETDEFLAGFERALNIAAQRGADAADCCAAAAEWTLNATRGNPLVRAALTGCRSERLPAAAVVPGARVPRARAGDQVLSPEELIAAMRGRATAVLERDHAGADRAEVGLAGEAVVRLTLSYVVAPVEEDEEACRQVARTVRRLLTSDG
jgi:AcrR family transcriptional regulator